MSKRPREMSQQELQLLLSKPETHRGLFLDIVRTVPAEAFGFWKEQPTLIVVHSSMCGAT